MLASSLDPSFTGSSKTCTNKLQDKHPDSRTLALKPLAHLELLSNASCERLLAFLQATLSSQATRQVLFWDCDRLHCESHKEENVQTFVTPSLNAYAGLKSKFGRSTQISMLLERHGSLKHCFTGEIYTWSRRSGGCMYNPVHASQHLVVGAHTQKIKTCYARILFSPQKQAGTAVFTQPLYNYKVPQICHPREIKQVSFLLVNSGHELLSISRSAPNNGMCAKMCKLKMLATLNTSAN